MTVLPKYRSYVLSDHGHTPTFITTLSILLGLSLVLLFYQITYLKGLFLLLGFLGLILIILIPELSLLLAFSSSIFKEWLSFHVPIFTQVDFTVAIFGLAFLSILFATLSDGTLFTISFHKSFLPLFLLTAFMLFSILYTPSFKYGVSKSFSFLFFNWSLFLFPVFLIQHKKNAWRLVYISVVLATLVSIFTMVTLVQSILQKSIIFTYRASFLGTNPISYASWCGAINILLISTFPRIKGRKQRSLAFLVVGLLFFTLLAANSRGPLVSFLLTATLMVIINFKKIPKVKLSIAFIAVVALLILFFSLLPTQVTHRYTDIFQGKGASRSYYTVDSRLFAWKVAFHTATAKISTLFFGTGSGGFSNAITGMDIRVYPHNIFLEVLCELGLLGVFLIVWHFLLIIQDSIKILKEKLSSDQKSLIMAFLMAAIFSLLAAQFSGDLNDNRRLWLFLGVLTAFIKMGKQNIINFEKE